MLRKLSNGEWIFECDANERVFINKVTNAAAEHGMKILQFEYTYCEYVVLKFCQKGDSEREWCCREKSPRTDCHIPDEIDGIPMLRKT